MFTSFLRTRLRYFLPATALFFSLTSLAGFPSKPGEDVWANRPNDPMYAHSWQLFSHIPKNHSGVVSAFEKAIGSGLHADRAWQLHLGTPNTVIAVLDSGIIWGSFDLLERYYLNKRELPLPEGSTKYDKNGDGRFSVSDYKDDSRVSDKNGNGRIDPGDLIEIFSNGIDEDENGFTDDISGWDFHEHDNNPEDRTSYGHGTGEALDSAAAINNGYGEAGICGDCSVIALRLNDSFIVDANAFAAAVVYAADNGASLIQQALGSVNHSPFTRRAIEYSYKKNVPIIGSAADEMSYHHNYPSTIDPVIYANAIRYDSDQYQEASTYLNFNNCSNYGARVDVAVPGRYCSSEATGRLSGVAALAVSYARFLGKPLTAGELNSLVKHTTIDINLGSNENDPYRYSSYKGWDTLSGYGRANAHSMLKAIKEDKIRPEGRILYPHWFSIFTENNFDTIPVKVRVPLPRSGKSQVTLSVFAGVETAGAKPVLIKRSDLLRNSIEGEFAQIRLSDLKALSKNTLDEARNKYAYTIVLSIDDRNGQVAESRKTVFVFDDPNLKPGFPIQMAGSGESAGFFLDLNLDGKQEFITGDGAGLIHAYTVGGKELVGFPVRMPDSRYEGMGQRPAASIVAATAGGDLNQDGKLEVVAVSFEGHLNVVGANGKSLEGFPLELPFYEKTHAAPHQVIANGVMASPVLADLTGDKTKEIIIPSFDGQIHVYDHKGKAVKGFPVALKFKDHLAKLVSSPVIFDVNKDGINDLIMGSNHKGQNTGYLFAIDGKGNAAERLIIKGFPTKIPLIRDELLPTIGVGIPTAPALADLDGDKIPEILVHAFVGKSYIVGINGKIKASLSMKVGEGHNTNDSYMVSAFGHPAMGDLSGDGKFNPVSVGVGKRMLTALVMGGKRFEVDHMVGAWDLSSKKMLTGFPKKMEDTLISPSPIVVDVDGDGLNEAVVGSGGYFLHAFNKFGNAKGFPHFTGGWMYGAPSAGDLDGDGKIEIAVTTREGYVFIYKTESKSLGLGSWPTYKANSYRTGYQG